MGALAAEPAAAADAAPPSAPVTAAPARNQALIEVIDRDGHVRQAWPITAWPVRVGRALDNDVVLSDPHVAAHHFSVEAEGGRLWLHARETVNGVILGNTRVAAGMATALPEPAAGIDLVAGRTRLRLRAAGAALEAEEPLASLAVRSLRPAPTIGLALVLLAGLAFNAYLDADPDNLVRVAGNTLLAGLTGVAVWCGGWALLSKTITRQAHLGWHLRVFLTGSLALLALELVPGLLAFALSWPWLSDYSFVATFAVGAATLYFHLLALEPARPRLLRWVMATGALVGIGLTLWFNVQRTSLTGEELYMSHLFPPALRLAKPVPTERFVEGLGSLHGVLDKKAQEPANADAGATPPRNDDDE